MLASLAFACSLLALAPPPAVAREKAPDIGPTAPAGPVDDRGRFELLTAQVAACWDSARGAFVSKDDLPSESAVELGLLLGRKAAHREWRGRALASIDWTRSLMDTLSGGFVTSRERGGADLDAFTMRTDVNARRLANLIAAWQAGGDERHLRDARRVANYVDRVLVDGRGGFVTVPVGDRTLEPASNGVAIHAWLRWAAATHDPRVRDFALRSIERVWESCFDPLGVLLRRGTFGEVMVAPQLIDQVEMGRALVLASQLCNRPQDLKRAEGLGRVVIEKFPDAKRGGFMTQAMPKKDGTIRRADRRADENARAALFLAELAAATGDDAFRDAARGAWDAFAEDQEKMKLDAADWALAFHAAFAPETPASPSWQSAAAEPPPGPAVLYRTERRKKR